MTGDPVLQVYCHCTRCRAWSGAPVTACVLWPSALVRTVRGEAHLISAPGSSRKACGLCGGAVKTELPGPGLTDVFAGVIAAFEFRPTAHINYENHVLQIRDGLPKYRDMPERSGGSGLQMAE
jgi:hypothetical protein